MRLSLLPYDCWTPHQTEPLAHRMDWPTILADRLVSTPAIHWLDDGRLDLAIDGDPLSYSCHQKVLLSLLGRSIKRGQNLALFVPCISDADLSLVISYCYFLWTDVRSHVSLPGRWLNRRVADTNSDLMVIGNAPAMRQLLIDRTRISNQPLEDYLGIFWPTRRGSNKQGDSFVGQTDEREMGVYLVPKARVHESQFAKFREACSPFAVIIDVTSFAGWDSNLLKQYHVCKDAFPSVPVIFLCAAGDVAVMKMLRDETGIAIWVNRADDIRRIDELDAVHRLPQSGLLTHSLRLAKGINVAVEVIHDTFLDSALGDLLSVLHRLKEEGSAEDWTAISNASTMLRDLAALSVPLTTQEELYRLERRRGPYVTRLLRNRLDDLKRETGSVGVVTELLASLCEKATNVSKVLAKRNALTGKANALLDWLRRNGDWERETVLVCPNESIRAATLAFLSAQGIDTFHRPIRTVTQRNLWRQIRYGRMPNDVRVLWFGMPNFYTGAFFGGGLADLSFMVYPSERAAMERQLGYIEHNTQKLSDLTGDKVSFLTDSSMPILDRCVAKDCESPWHVSWRDVHISGVYPGDIPEIPQFALPDADWITDWLNQPPSPASSGRAPSAEQGVVISLSDGEPDIVLPADGSILVLDEIADTAEGMVDVSMLQAGMTILVPRDSPSTPLIDRLMDNLRREPAYLMNEKLAERWYLAVETIASRTRRDYDLAFHRLKKFGVAVDTPQAVYVWFSHNVIGPRSIRSLKAVAEAAEMPEIVANINPIWGAIKYVRRTRRLLRRQIAAYTRSGMFLRGDTLINRELGLYGSDLEDLTRVGEILQITYSE